MPQGRPAVYRRAIRTAMRSRFRPSGLMTRAPAIFDPVGLRVLRRTMTPGGVVSGKRRR